MVARVVSSTRILWSALHLVCVCVCVCVQSTVAVCGQSQWRSATHGRLCNSQSSLHKTTFETPPSEKVLCYTCSSRSFFFLPSFIIQNYKILYFIEVLRKNYKNTMFSDRILIQISFRSENETVKHLLRFSSFWLICT